MGMKNADWFTVVIGFRMLLTAVTSFGASCADRAEVAMRVVFSGGRKVPSRPCNGQTIFWVFREIL
jgi:hypothetical protein